MRREDGKMERGVWRSAVEWLQSVLGGQREGLMGWNGNDAGQVGDVLGEWSMGG